MIVPSNRLLLWAALILIPFGLLSAAGRDAILISLLAAAGFFVVLLIDAALGMRLLDSIEVAAPELGRLVRNQPGSLTLLLTRTDFTVSRLRIGLAFPLGFESPSRGILVDLPGDNETLAVAYPCTPSERGRTRLNLVYLETRSRLQLWKIRRTIPITCEVRVYPDLSRERRVLAAFFLRRGVSGMRMQRQVGKGREFDRLRDYQNGDSYDEVHWKASAKRGRPVTKLFRLERTQEIYVVIDSSRLSGRLIRFSDDVDSQKQSASETMLEQAVTAALVLGQVAERNGDLFGLVTHADRVETLLRARGGRQHFRVIRDSLISLETRQVSPDYVELCSTITAKLRRRALLVFLTSLDDPVLAEQFVQAVKIIGRKHLAVVGMVRPREARQLFTDADEDVATVDDLYLKLGGHLLWNQLRELVRTLRRQGISVVQFDEARMAPDLVSTYMAIKQRQLL